MYTLQNAACTQHSPAQYKICTLQSYTAYTLQYTASALQNASCTQHYPACTLQHTDNLYLTIRIQLVPYNIQHVPNKMQHVLSILHHVQ